jgi:phosphomannomutase
VTSYTVTALKADGAIMITASHNPAEYNGFKYKVASGSSAPTEIIAKIEQSANDAAYKGSMNRLDLAEGLRKKLVTYHDPYHAYERHLNRLINIEALKQNKLKIVVDSMFGAGIGYFKSLLDGGQIEVHEINKVRNPLFPGIHRSRSAKI